MAKKSKSSDKAAKKVVKAKKVTRKQSSKKKSSAKRGGKLPVPGFLRKFFAYFRDSFREIKKVTWPSRKETFKLTIAVLLFTAAFTVLSVGVDYIFQNLAERLFLS